MKKNPEQKLISQIDRLKAKQAFDVGVMSKLVLDAEKISHKSDVKLRKAYSDMTDLIDKISACVERRRRLLWRKAEKLSEIRTAELIAASLS